MLPEKPADRRGDLIAVAVMAVLTLAVFWQAFVRPDDMLREDAAHFYQPYYTFANQEIAAGRLPLWNPYTKMGVPFHASLQPSLLYPLRWPAFFMDYVTGFTVTMMVHYFLTALAAYVLIRMAMGVGPLGALAGALSIAFGGFAMGHMTHTTYFLSYPWFLLCVLFIWLGVERRRWAWALPAGGCIGLMGLVGSVHLFLILGVLLGTYVIYHTAVAAVVWFRDKTTGWVQIARPAGVTGAALLLGGLISAAQILPAQSVSKRSARQAATWEYINRGCAHPVRNTVQMVVPFHYGNCRLRYWGEYMYHGAAHYTGILLLLGAAVSFTRIGRDRRLWFWVVLAIVGFLVGAGEYLPVYGALYETIGLFRRLRNPTRIFWMTDIAIAVLGAVGIDHVLTRQLHRPERSRARVVGLAAGAVILLILVGSLVKLSEYAANPDDLVEWVKTQKFRYGMNLLGAKVAPAKVMHEFDPASWGSVAAIVASVGAFVVLLLRGRPVGKVGAAVLVAILMGDLFCLSFGMIMYEDRWSIVAEPPARAKWLAENLGLQRYLVVPGPPNAWPQNEQVVRARSVQFGLRNTGGKAEGIIDSQGRLRYVRAMLPSRGMRTGRDVQEWYYRLGRLSALSGTKYLLLLNELSHPVFRLENVPGGQFGLVKQDGRFRVYQNQVCLPMAYFVRRVTRVAQPPAALAQLLSRDFNVRRDAVVVGSPPPATARSAARSARVTNVETVPGRWVIDTDCDAPAQLVVLEGYDDGWRGTLGGKPTEVYQTNDQVMSVAVPAGRQRIVLEYAPAEFTTGVVLTAIGLVFTGGLAVAAWLTGRRRPAGAADEPGLPGAQPAAQPPAPRPPKHKKKRKH